MKSSFVVTFALALLGAAEAGHLARRGLDNNHQLARDGGGTHAARTVPCKRGTDGTPDCEYPGHGHPGYGHHPGGPGKPGKPGKPGHGGDDDDDNEDPVVTPTAGIPAPPPPAATPTPGIPGGNNTLPVEPPVVVAPELPDPPVVNPPPVETPVPTPTPGYGGGGDDGGEMTVQPIEPGVPRPTPETGNGDEDEDCDDDKKKARRGFRFWA
jgi:hypothetical protein